jgi:hypothetical protein
MIAAYLIGHGLAIIKQFIISAVPRIWLYRGNFLPVTLYCQIFLPHCFCRLGWVKDVLVARVRQQKNWGRKILARWLPSSTRLGLQNTFGTPRAASSAANDCIEDFQAPA